MGVVDTPGFVAVGTNGALKYVDNQLAIEAGQQLMFCNTYHLMIHPGAEVIREAGGLHAFIGRKHPIITDSGGFQVFSLAYSGASHDELKGKAPKQYKNSVKKISEEGIVFRSYRDGTLINLTPESSVEFQKVLNSDIIIPLDELLPMSCSREQLVSSLERTHRWEARSLAVHRAKPQGQAMYAVVHGGTDRELRHHSAAVLGAMDFEGFALGGSLGRDRKEMLEVLAYTMPLIRPGAPVHLLGIADPDSIADAAAMGVDTFDSCYPTRSGRHGTLFTTEGFARIMQSKYRSMHAPLDPECGCPACTHYTASYLHHLFKMNEPVGQSLGAAHNMFYMLRMMKNVREAILENRI